MLMLTPHAAVRTFTLMKTAALRIGPARGRIAVSGNSFCNSYIGDGAVKCGTDDLQAAGLVLAGANDVGISGNVFSGLQPKAFALEGDAPAGRVLFSDNITVDAETDLAKLKESAGNLVTDNLGQP